MLLCIYRNTGRHNALFITSLQNGTRQRLLHQHLLRPWLRAEWDGMECRPWNTYKWYALQPLRFDYRRRQATQPAHTDDLKQKRFTLLEGSPVEPFLSNSIVYTTKTMPSRKIKNKNNQNSCWHTWQKMR